MGRRSSHHSRREGESKRKRRHSSSSSSSGETTDVRLKDERIKLLEDLVLKLSQASSQTSQPQYKINIRQGDEWLIPIFDPSEDDANVEEWTEQVDSIAEQFGWDGRAILRLIVTRLKGHAKQWYEKRRESTNTWDDVKTIMIQQFRKSLPFAKLIKEAVLYEAAPDQALGDYCFEKLNRIKKLTYPIADEHVIDMIIDGINHNGIERSARAAQYKDVNLFYNYMTTLGKMPPKRGSRKENASESENGRSDKRGITDRTEKKKVREQDKKYGRNTVGTTPSRCFNCGQSGHLARDCKKPRVECSSCKRLGHTSDKCYKTKDVTMVMNAPERNQNVYACKARVNDQDVGCLVDTGSARTIIRSSAVDKLKVKVSAVPSVNLRGFAGPMVTTNKSARVKVALKQVSAEIDALVVPDGYVRYDLVIGRDYLDRDDIVLIKSGDALLVKQCNQKDIDWDNVFGINICDSLAEEHVRIGDVTNEEKEECCELLKEFEDCISSSLQNLGKTETATMEIRCVSDLPVAHRPYRLPEVEKTIVRELIQDLLNNGIIRESNSPYASPILLVKKKTGEHRMCVDFRKLNAITVKDKYPMPLIEEQIDKLGGQRYFTTLDLASGYYQVPLSEDAIPKTAFVTPDGHYEFLRMPFGLANAPATFQRMINKALGKLKDTIAFPYMDDIIIPSKTVEEGIRRLRQVLLALRENKLTLKLSKCSFLEKTVEYLGREISESGVRPTQRKVKAVLDMQEPRTVKQVRQFVGLASYFRKFIENFATVIEPLTRLTRKGVPWQWSDAQRGAMDAIKTKLTTRPILAIFDPTKETELHTDASSRGVGGMLIQRNGRETAVVSYFSKQLTKDQRCYHSYELETMAVVLSLRYFRVYLLGITFKVITDCNSLRTTFSRRDLLPRVGRWWLEVQDFTFSIEYRAGTKMAHVDALSRNPVIEETVEINAIDLTEGDWLLTAQLQDEQLDRIRRILEDGQITNETKQYFQEYVLKNGKLHRRLDGQKTAWIVPRNARMQICRLCHDDAGHLSAEKTVERIKRHYWFANMRRFVSKYVSACLNCAYYKDTRQRKQGKLNCIEKIPVPYHTIHVDHVGPFETSRKGNKYLLVVVDGFTKFTIIEPVRTQKTRHTVKALLEIICLFGCPTRIISDRGTAFTSSAFKMFCTTYGIKHVLNAVATPRANGQCERYNRTIISSLAATVAGKDPRDWDRDVKGVQSALNTIYNKGIGTTPTKALIGCDVRSAAEAPLLMTIGNEIERIDLKELRRTIAEHVTADQKRQKESYDRSRKDARKYRQGELILLRITSEPSTGASRKLTPKFKGPFRVHATLPNDRYEVEDVREGRKRVRTVVAADHMKPWITIQDDDAVPESD